MIGLDVVVEYSYRFFFIEVDKNLKKNGCVKGKCC